MATWFAQNSSVNIDSVNQWNSAANGSGSWLTWASLGASDILVANGKTSITINVNVTCSQIRGDAYSGGTANGSFILAAGITITASITAGSSGNFISLSGAGSDRYVVGNCSTSGNANVFYVGSSSDMLWITGNVRTDYNSRVVYSYDRTNVNITGNVIATGSVAAIEDQTSAAISTITVTGDVTSTGTRQAIFVNAQSSSPLCRITGTVTASASCGAVYFGGTIVIAGNQVSGSGGHPSLVYSLISKVLIHATNQQSITYRVDNSGTAGVARSLYTGGTNLGQPTAANVRSGTTYGASSEYTGTLAVPSPTLVAIGVATDNTVGSYAPTGGLDAAGVRSAIGLASANLDTQLSGLQSDTNDIQSRIPAALEGGRIAAALDSASRDAVADAVWDEAMSGHTTSGTYGARVVRGANSNVEVQITGSQHVAADVHEFQAGVITAGDFANNSLTAAALAADAVAEIQNGLSTLTASQVNAEVVDALSVDTYAELTAPPAATSSLKDKLTWLFMYARNKVTQTATQRKLYRDDGATVAGTSGTTDDGTTFTKGEDA